MDRMTKIEKELIRAILQGDYPAGSQMETERELADTYRIGRPAVREILQRLSHGGWLTMKKGHRTVVNDYWQEGNSTTIVDIIESVDEVPDALVLYFLEMRIALTPQYVKRSVQLNYPKVVGVLSEMDELPDTPQAFACYDWRVQTELAGLSGNPIFLLILNSFEPAYLKIAEKYFESSFRREVSLRYYQDLLETALKGDSLQAEKLAHAVMEKSYSLWEEQLSPQEKIGVKFQLEDM